MNILHLSDIHFGRNYKCYGIKDIFDDKDRILNELIECIRELGDFRPEHIVVTGDIAWHGKREEYEEAQEWFERLLKVVNLSGKNITFCVGNHDVNRSYASNRIKYKDNLINEIDEVYAYENVHELETPIYEYDRFCEKIGMEPYTYPCNEKMEYSYSVGYKDVKFPSQNKIRLVAFNTALLSFISSPEISQDKMWIGQKQILKLMDYGIIPSNEVYYTITLFHHAERFLHPSEICEYDGRISTLSLLREHVDLILCGHTETGGRPVLHQQLGGGKLLTAGAAYYSDTHPNAFSILCIPDSKKEVLINPFTYQNGWKNYSMEMSKVSNTKIEDLPMLGDLQKECKFVIETKSEKFEIPLKKISVYYYTKDNVPYIKFDNRKEVLRYLYIKYEGPVSGEKVDVSVEIAPKMAHSVRAMLKRDECFHFLSQNSLEGNKMSFYIESDSGIKILSGEELTVKVEEDQVSVLYLRRMKKIEDYYNIRFYCPEELHERDVETIDLLIELIEDGYTKELKLDGAVSTKFADYEKLKLFYEQAMKQNSFCLIYDDSFICDIFDVKIDMGTVRLVAGVYQVDLENVRRKLETFEQGDSRQIHFTTLGDFQTYFIVDKDKTKEKIEMESESIAFGVGKMVLKWGDIYNT